MSLSRGQCALCAWIIALVSSLSGVCALGATSAEVEAAIEKAKGYLYAQQNESGNWEKAAVKDPKEAQHTVAGGQWGGLTSMATYALLAAGESHKEPRLAKAITFVKKSPMNGIYALGFRTQVWTLLPPTGEIRALANRDGVALAAAAKGAGDARGMYGYFVNDASKSQYDHSTSQFGVMGMYGCIQAGYQCPASYWKIVEKSWRDHQYEDGSWAYTFRSTTGKNPTMNMTTAGVASLYMIQEFLRLADAVDAKGNARDENLERGVKWINDHFANVLQVHGGELPVKYYALFGIQRIGSLSGMKHFGAIDWYKHGAELMVRAQQPDGSWSNVPDTCLALLFLVHGRAAIAINKLEYDFEQPGGAEAKPGNWNFRPRDTANITRWIAYNAEWRLNWQIVNLKAHAEDLVDAPVLYIAGNQPLEFSDEQAGKLKNYVEQGGLILANADGASKEFAASFKKLGTRLFPAYEFRELRDGHIIYTGEQFQRKQWKEPPVIEALSNGVRELMVLIPAADAARYWQTQAFKDQGPLFEVAANIFEYAIDRRPLRAKDARVAVVRDNAVATRHNLKVARLRHLVNWDPEPGGWRRFADLLHNQHGVDLAIEPVALGGGKLDSSYALAHMTGTAPFKLTDPQIAELRKYIQGGGTILVDAAGGAPTFAEAARRELPRVIEGGKWATVAADDLLLIDQVAAAAATQPATQPVAESTTRPATMPATMPTTMASTRPALKAGALEVEYRPFARKRFGGQAPLRLQGIQVGGRWVILFSAEDISHGLVGQNIDGIFGYAPATATEIVKRVILNGCLKK